MSCEDPFLLFLVNETHILQTCVKYVVFKEIKIDQAEAAFVSV